MIASKNQTDGIFHCDKASVRQRSETGASLLFGPYLLLLIPALTSTPIVQEYPIDAPCNDSAEAQNLYGGFPVCNPAWFSGVVASELDAKFLIWSSPANQAAIEDNDVNETVAATAPISLTGDVSGVDGFPITYPDTSILRTAASRVTASSSVSCIPVVTTIATHSVPSTRITTNTIAIPTLPYKDLTCLIVFSPCLFNQPKPTGITLDLTGKIPALNSTPIVQEYPVDAPCNDSAEAQNLYGGFPVCNPAWFSGVVASELDARFLIWSSPSNQAAIEDDDANGNVAATATISLASDASSVGGFPITTSILRTAASRVTASSSVSCIPVVTTIATPSVPSTTITAVTAIFIASTATSRIIVTSTFSSVSVIVGSVCFSAFLSRFCYTRNDYI
ncbi:hypothetical protein K493DRAFT_353164 [Basidiobolus meristosporus CBS 931.73]|uniref:Uncharacterized protein n=1 Tax=Basidiobolus meristosporus CBS 931.73 TaxID=1314790 RepID=A0A1Y1Y6V3_9FUNG|nr:hypothetical protein K493DRAFT_353164 [Basidiobolus meristosporus CBS 931.73]|eukprot:ORX93699.1 hypothetical protein K493DRAFT_353164 [Basidiobolus meristosporus CBS 931.73]